MSKQQKTLRNLFPRIGKACVSLLLAGLAMTSCSDLQEYFDEHMGASETIYTILSNDGNYSQFLTGATIADYQPLLDGKAIVTVMAPTDEQMKAYLEENYGVSDIILLPLNEIKKLIGFHILYYSFDKNKLMNFRPNEGDGATEEQLLVNAGEFYKFRTRSKDDTTHVYGRVYSVNTPDNYQDVAVGHLERYIPVFSGNLFTTRVLDGAMNYNYFYPNTSFDASGFNVANAAVTDYAIASANGYIYKIDRVIRPLETINTELKNRSQDPDDPEGFSRYYNMYNAYSNYVLDDEQTTTNGYDTYKHLHNYDPATNNTSGVQMTNIDQEWPVDDEYAIADLSRKSYSVFAFSNQAFMDFFNSYWGEGGYTSPEDPDLQENISDLLLNTFGGPKNPDTKSSKKFYDYIVFPQELQNKEIVNKDGNILDVDINSVKQDNRVICSNGVLYGCSNIIPPAKYYSVTGPAFQSTKFSYFRQMINAAGTDFVSDLSSRNIGYIMLFPTNDQMQKKEGYKPDVDGNLVNKYSPTGVKSSVMVAAPYAHTIEITDVSGNTLLPTSGTKVYPDFGKGAQSSNIRLYLFVKDGKITNSIQHNQLLYYQANPLYKDGASANDSVWAQFHLYPYRGDNDGWLNGHCYTYDNLVFHGNFEQETERGTYASLFTFTEDKVTTSGLIPGNGDDTKTEFYAFYQLLLKAGLVNGGQLKVVDSEKGTFSNVSGANWMFIPTTTALVKALKEGRLEKAGISKGDPTIESVSEYIKSCTVTDKVALARYLESYFVPIETASVSTTPYLGWDEDTEKAGGLQTLDSETKGMEVIYTYLNVYDEGSRLTVGRVNRNGEKSSRVPVSSNYDYFPFTFKDGPMHFLDDILPLVNDI